MIRTTFSRVLVSLVVALASGLAQADDIDIFSNNPAITTNAPNVLIIMDNTANWSQSFAGSTKFAAEKAALATVVTALKAEFNLGLMLFTETGGSNSNTDGGYVRFAIQPMSDSTGAATAARNCLLQMVGSGSTCTLAASTYYTNLDIGNDKSNGGKAGVTMGEAYDYLAGVNAYAGTNKVKADYTRAFTSGAIAGPTYKSPAAVSCQKNFIIVLSNGPFQDNSSDTATATTQLISASGSAGSAAVINPPDNGTSQNNVADEWVRFLNKVDSVQATTYTVEVGPSSTGQGPYNTALLQSMGRQGKGGYFAATDAASLLAVLTRIFNDIQAVNSVFASSSLPLSADNTGNYSDQIYMAVFRPDGQGRPRWLGNLKQYKFALDTNRNLQIVDSGGLPAAGTDGFATPDAVSFWTSKVTTAAPDAAFQASTGPTDGSTGGFWFFDSKGSGGNFDSPDGEWVEKGGAAQQLRLAYLGYGNRGGIGDTNASTPNGKPARQIYTCTGSCLTTSGTSLSGTPFDTSNSAITDALLGTQTASVSSITSAASKSVSALSAGIAVNITSAVKSSGLVTTATPHPFVVGDSVYITGTSSNKLNDNNTAYIIAAPVTANSFTISNGDDATGGTASKATTTATATTTTAHGFTVGQRITVAGVTGTSPAGGTWPSPAVVTVASVPDANHFTYTISTALWQNATGTVTATSNTATVTASGHGFSTGQSVTIAGATPAGYNGVWTATVADSSTFTYVYSVPAPLANATGTIIASIGGGRTTLIRWFRGLDTQDENGFQVNGQDTDVRASIHGDILHQRPVVLNYGTPTAGNNIYVFYGGNDGVFRAIKGGQAATDGKEQWAFVPQEFFPKFLRLYNNSPQVLYPSTPAGITPTPTKRDYFWDGPVGTYLERNTDGTVKNAYLYIAVRRGGRFIYALDVTTPTAPKFMWRKGCTTAYPDNSGCDAGFAELGQTWSQPTPIKLNTGLVNTPTKLAVIFAAGYDATSEDAEPPAATDNVGRAVYVLDALTGAPLWAAGNTVSTLPSGVNALAVTGMDFSIAADVLAVDRKESGFTDRVYAADVGGTVWRLDIGDSDTSKWVVSKIASISNRSAPASSRKFFFSPDVVLGAPGTFDALVIGSGDREHPLSTNAAQAVVNRVYMFKDTHTSALTARTDLGITDTACNANVTNPPCLFDATNSASVPPGSSGWFVTLLTGEKVINGPIVVGGEAIFGTNQPDTSNTSCTANLGIARRYDVNYTTGAAGGGITNSSGVAIRSDIAAGGGFLPGPTSGVLELPDGTTKLFVIDNPLSPGGVTPTVNVPTTRFRTFWRELLE